MRLQAERLEAINQVATRRRLISEPAVAEPARVKRQEGHDLISQGIRFAQAHGPLLRLEIALLGIGKESSRPGQGLFIRAEQQVFALAPQLVPGFDLGPDPGQETFRISNACARPKLLEETGRLLPAERRVLREQT